METWLPYSVDMSRKHQTQFTKEERGFVHGFVRANVSRLTSTNTHFVDRATERHFTFDEAAAVVKGGLVVEVHNDKPGDVRCLVRNSQGTCVVVSLVRWEVITVYYNDPADQHETLNWNVYRWNQNLVELIKQLRRAQ